jgi:hypothetical protein
MDKNDPCYHNIWKIGLLKIKKIFEKKKAVLEAMGYPNALNFSLKIRRKAVDRLKIPFFF